MRKIFRKIVLICLILINFIANAQQVPSYVPSSGLVGWWPFTGNAIDSSGNGNNGTVNGATLTTDRFGVSNKAYFFDGFNDNISLSRINVSQAVTLSVWVKNKKTSGYWRGIVTTQNNNTQGFLLQDASGSLKYDWTVSNGNGYYDLYNSTLIDTSKWVHIVGVITSDSMLIYYNGNLESQRGIGSRNLASTANLWFGSRYSSEYFNGKLDDIGLWNRQLSNSEIHDLYKSNTCTTTSSTDTITSCGAYTWTDGVTYTTSNNTAKDTFTNAAGCDSIVTLNLSIAYEYTQVGSDIDGEAADDQSGYSVSLSSDGSTVAIGARYNDGNGSSAGHVRVYKSISGTWTQVGSDIDGEAAGDVSGYSVSLSSDGSNVAIGAYGNDGNGSLSGHVRIYKNISGTWTQQGSDIDGEAAGDWSGYSVSLSSDGSTVAIGALFNDGNGNRAGHVRIYNIGSIYVPQTSSTDTIISCGAYTWTNGVTYTTSNITATDTFVNALGCDSIVTLNLTVLPPSTIYIGSSNISSDTVICSNQNITLRYDTSNQTSSGSAASISGYAFLGSYGVNNYYVSNSASNWSTANQSAISNGGHLADISSSGENSFLASKISTYSWIGYNDVASEGSFVWSSGSQSTYTNWRSSSNEPNNSGGNEDYTLLHTNQEWSDWNGSTYHILEVSTISVLWSTGETSIEINVSPDTSTVYWVSSGGCRDSITITVQDIIKPTVVTQNLTVSLDASGAGSITATQVDNGSTDNCTIAKRTLSKSSFDCSNVGTNTIYLIVTDVNGNIDSASAVVTVQDIIKPTVLTQNVTVSLDASGAGSVTVTDIDNGSTDNCSIATSTLSKSSFDCSKVGANTIWLRVTDVNGNIDSAIAVVTVQDIIKPTVVTTPNDIALGYCDATYTYAIPTGDDNCGVTVTQIAGLPPGSTFPVGLTVNTFEISDPSGNTVTTSFTIDIRARYMPFTNLDISLCNNNSKIDLTNGFDNIIFIGSGVEANEKFFNPNSLEPGSYSITAEFTDSMGCVSTEQFVMEIRSTPIVPRIKRVASDQIITAQAYGNYQWYRNGEELEGEDKQLLRVHELGIYSVLVGNDENCFEASEGYGFGIPVNEENVTNKGLVKVFPNPTRDVVFVQINDEVEFHLLTLSDAVGNKLIERETSTKVVKLDLTLLAPGTYYLNVLGGTTNETVVIVRL